jgi:hypothetical protein
VGLEWPMVHIFVLLYGLIDRVAKSKAASVAVLWLLSLLAAS